MLNRTVLLVTSTIIVLFIVTGGLLVKASSPDSSYRQAVLFAEVLSLVLDNYVDPVAPDGLLDGAYETMLGGLDAQGAFLTAAEVASYQKKPKGKQVDPGLTVLKLGRSVQIVGVVPDSSAAEAGIIVGDQIREIEGEEVADLSLNQVRRLLQGPEKSRIKMQVVHPFDDFEREDLELFRGSSKDKSGYEVSRDEEIAIVTVRSLRDLDRSSLAGELKELRSGETQRLLLDLRNVADSDPRAAGNLASLFVASPEWVLRAKDGAGREEVAAKGSLVWDGPIDLLVNAATAWGGEAVVAALKTLPDTRLFGEATFGLAGEPELLMLQDGSGLLLPTTQWTFKDQPSWHGDGFEPDKRVRGRGDDYDEAIQDQLQKTLDLIRNPDQVEAEEKAAA